MNDDQKPQPEAQVVERTGWEVVGNGQIIWAAGDTPPQLALQGATVVHYYFPVEIEVIGPGPAEALMEQIYAAIQQGLEGLM